jgi:hypothetical protein
MTIRTLFAAESTERGGWLRHLLFPGVMGVVVAIVMELFQLLNAAAERSDRPSVALGTELRARTSYRRDHRRAA